MLLRDLARAAGVKPEVARYYVRIGLVTAVDRDANGYRRFSISEVERIRFIREAQAIGFRLADIRALLEHTSPGSRDYLKFARRRLEARLEDLRREAARLQRLAEAVVTTLDDWPEDERGADTVARAGKRRPNKRGLYALLRAAHEGRHL